MLWSFLFTLISPPNDQGLNTTGTLVSICQNDKFSFSFLQNTYLGLAQAITSTMRYVLPIPSENEIFSFCLHDSIDQYTRLLVYPEVLED